METTFKIYSLAKIHAAHWILGACLSLSISASAEPFRFGVQPFFTPTPTPLPSPYPAEYWKQPNVGCLEEIYDGPAPGKCPDLSHAEITADMFGRNLDGICVAEEVIRRENLNHGSQPFMKTAWLVTHSVKDREQKLKWIAESAKKFTMPPQFLYGVLQMETMVTDLPLTSDYGNYSCGTGSMNIASWCKWISTKSPAFQKALGWPVGMSCEEPVMSREITGALYEVAYPNQELPYEDLVDGVVAKLDAVSDLTVLNRLSHSTPLPTIVLQLQAIRSFSRTCGNPKYGIEATAFLLKSSFDRLVPIELKMGERYQPGETYNRACKTPYTSPYYPMHSGWLLTYGVHNMGEEATDVFKYYYGLNVPGHTSPMVFHPQDVIHGLYEGGKINPDDVTELHYLDSDLLPQETEANLACQAHANIVYMARGMAFVNPIHVEESSECTEVTPERLYSSGIFSGKHRSPKKGSI